MADTNDAVPLWIHIDRSPTKSGFGGRLTLHRFHNQFCKCHLVGFPIPVIQQERYILANFVMTQQIHDTKKTVTLRFSKGVIAMIAMLSTYAPNCYVRRFNREATRFNQITTSLFAVRGFPPLTVYKTRLFQMNTERSSRIFKEYIMEAKDSCWNQD